MAWYNNGNWDGVPVEKLGHILSDLCIAVNERENVTGIPETSWALVSKTRPVPADFDGIAIYSIDGTPTIIGQLHTAIEHILHSYGIAIIVGASYKQMISWAKSDVDRTEYTDIADLLGDGSYGTSWVTATRAQDPSICLQIKECLDILKYPCIRFGADLTEGAFDYRDGPDGGTWEQAWDNAKVAAWKGGGLTGDYTFVTHTLDITSNDPYANLDSYVDWTGIDANFFTAGLQGTLLEGYLGIKWTGATADQRIGTITFDIDLGGGVTLSASISASQDTWYHTSISLGADWPSVGSDSHLGKITHSITVNSPFDEAAGGGTLQISYHIGSSWSVPPEELLYGPSSWQTAGKNDNATRAYMDISSLLTN